MHLKPTGVKWGRWLAGLAVLVSVGAASWQAVLRGKDVSGSIPPDPPATVDAGDGVVVEVTSPRPGGIDRVCLQPGTIEPIQAADLYAKVSGFLAEQKVDIGDQVRAGDVLARVAVPEYETQVKQDAAEVARAEAKVEQMAAAIATAEAEVGAATAAIALAEAEKKSKTSNRALRAKQRDRIQELVARQAVEARLGDEHEDQYQAAVSAELAATEAVGAARQKEAAARAKVRQARADLKHAEAEVVTAKARLEKSQVLLGYTVIRSPYTGVVTRRNYHPGDFVRSAEAGGERLPVLAVERTDVMRVVIQVPERDVPFVDLGDPAVVEVDALPGVVFKSDGADKVVVSRLAASEDHHTRMMRTEVHVKNPKGKLRRGMFGRVSLTLHVGEPGALRVPSAALAGKADGKKGTVRVARDSKAHLVPVRYGADNGSEVEILSGLTRDDRVIVRASGPLEEGTAVEVTDAKLKQAGH
jgi:HlyD family secretion protein